MALSPGISSGFFAMKSEVIVRRNQSGRRHGDRPFTVSQSVAMVSPYSGSDIVNPI